MRSPCKSNIEDIRRKLNKQFSSNDEIEKSTHRFKNGEQLARIISINLFLLHKNADLSMLSVNVTFSLLLYLDSQKSKGPAVDDANTDPEVKYFSNLLINKSLN